jgi:COMPASS component BRE2
MSPYMLIDEECKTITTEKGFRMVRANCGVREGQWYYEVTIDRGGEPRYEGRDGAHVRLGWARREGNQTTSSSFASIGNWKPIWSNGR